MLEVLLAVRKHLNFLDFLIKGEGLKYLTILKRKRINLINVSSILSRSSATDSKAFKDLYALWSDKERNKTKYLKSLEEEEINLANVSGILHTAGAKAPKTFKDLQVYDLWFDYEEHKIQYLKSLQEVRINLGNVSGILHIARVKVLQRLI